MSAPCDPPAPMSAPDFGVFPMLVPTDELDPMPVPVLGPAGRERAWKSF